MPSPINSTTTYPLDGVLGPLLQGDVEVLGAEVSSAAAGDPVLVLQARVGLKERCEQFMEGSLRLIDHLIAELSSSQK